jgi:hypothetical protein
MGYGLWAGETAPMPWTWTWIYLEATRWLWRLAPSCSVNQTPITSDTTGIWHLNLDSANWHLSINNH